MTNPPEGIAGQADTEILLFFTGHVPTLRELYPEREVLFEVWLDAAT